MLGWHHQLDGHEFEQASQFGDGQGSLACSSPWGYKESDTTEQLNSTELKPLRFINYIRHLSALPMDRKLSLFLTIQIVLKFGRKAESSVTFVQWV